jgi:hypothetical protein
MSNTERAIKSDALDEKVRAHQPVQSDFKAIMSDDIDWTPFAAFPHSVRLAVVVGQPQLPDVTKKVTWLSPTLLLRRSTMFIAYDDRLC